MKHLTVRINDELVPQIYNLTETNVELITPKIDQTEFQIKAFET